MSICECTIFITVDEQAAWDFSGFSQNKLWRPFCWFTLTGKNTNSQIKVCHTKAANFFCLKLPLERWDTRGLWQNSIFVSLLFPPLASFFYLLEIKWGWMFVPAWNYATLSEPAHASRDCSALELHSLDHSAVVINKTQPVWFSDWKAPTV